MRVFFCCILVATTTLLWGQGAVPQSVSPDSPARSSVPQQTPVANPPSAGIPGTPASDAVSPDLRIGSGDVLEVKIFTGYGTPDMTNTTRVDSKGSISLPLIGTVPVGGLTAEQVERQIEALYKDRKFLKNPHVSVFSNTYGSQGVSVFGEVNKPGVYQVFGPRTLLDLLSAAGGLTVTAGNYATITRRDGAKEPLKVELRDDGAPTDNVAIMPGDTVVVEKSGIVYVVGDVTKPGGFPVSNRTSLTVLQALALAEGTKPNAALNDAKLIRKHRGDLSEMNIPLSKILAGKADDRTLEAGDIIFVPTSLAKSATRKSLEAIVQLATGIAIYRR